MGVELLKELHNPDRKYERIIIVGHSLGSVIGYDILTHAWPDFNRKYTEGKEARDALDALEEIATSKNPGPDAVQAAQRRYYDELKSNDSAWRVTDLVTLGSPLAHSAILLAKDIEDLHQKQRDREFPRCLPALETVKRKGAEVRRFSYEPDPRKHDGYRIPHHAAVFGPTRWTNLFFPCRALVWGDVVGGPLSGVMGEHIRDVPVSTRQHFGFLTHTLYWSRSSADIGGSHIGALRDALDLTDQNSTRA